MPESAPTVRITLPLPLWIALGLFALVLVGGLTTQILLLEDQRTTVDRQLAVAAKQLDQVEPLLRDVQPLVRDVQPLVEDTRKGLPRSQQLTREALPLVQAATPLVTELDRARVGEQLQAAGALARSLLDAGAGRNLQRLPRLADDVARLPGLADDAAALTRDVSRISDTLLEQDRLQRVLVRSAATFGELRALHTVPKITRAAEIAPRQLTILEESLAVQREILTLTREGVAGVNELRGIGRDLQQIGRQTLTEAGRAARSAESLDRKLGGQLPTALGG
ncbi:MAG TPA: hypothetical protein VN238_08210 [Solirubrobacteraceae bacterium]|nr:hypothetical protein [Solirubrobacteraceae bacterium]